MITSTFSFGNIARNLGWMLSSRGIQAILSLVYLGIATRTLGIEDFGRLALMLGASRAVVTLIAFPTWRVVIQYGMTYLSEDDHAGYGRLLRICVIMDIGSALVGMVISTIVILCFSSLLGISPDQIPYVLAFSFILLASLRSTALGILRLRDLYSHAAYADCTTAIVRCIGAALAMWLSPNVMSFLLIWAIAEVATATSFWCFAGRTGDLRKLWNARVDYKAFIAKHPEFIRFVINGNASASLSLASKSVPLLFVGASLGPAAAGALRLAFQLSQSLSKLGTILSRAAFPELVKAAQNANQEILGGLVLRAILASSSIAVVILVIVIGGGKHILTFVAGPEFLSAYPLLCWLAVAGSINLATVVFEPLLIAMHKTGTVLICRLIAVASLLVGLVILVPVFDTVGATIAITMGAFIAAVLLGISCSISIRSHSSDAPKQ